MHYQPFTNCGRIMDACNFMLFSVPAPFPVFQDEATSDKAGAPFAVFQDEESKPSVNKAEEAPFQIYVDENNEQSDSKFAQPVQQVKKHNRFFIFTSRLWHNHEMG